MIPIYENEVKAGLSDVLKNTSIAYLSPITSTDLNHTLDITALKEKAIAAGFKGNKFGLYPLDSILASIGWNGNDDVFDKENTWQAKSSAVDRPVNFMHNESDIIGHMTSAIVIDNSGKVIAQDSKPEDIPDEFDILTSSVLYTTWSSEELQKRMDTLVEEIPQGKWFVSMECIFNDFDYAIITPKGEHKTIARNNQTSFLTKHLRIYGGTGVYQGHKLGRKLKNFVFIGKGIVDNPANKRSLILNKSTSFISKANLTSFKEKVDVMDEKELLALNAKLDSINKSVSEFTIVDLTKKVDEVFSKQVADLSKELENVKAENATLSSKVTELTDLVAKKDEAIKVSAVELTTIKRLAKATVKGLSSEEAEKLVNTCASVSDEQFDSLLSLCKPEEKVTKTQATEVIETIQTEKTEANLSVDAQKTTDEVRSIASEWFKNNVFTQAKAKK